MDDFETFVDYCILMGQSYAAGNTKLDEARKCITQIMASRERRAREEEREACAERAVAWFDSYVIDTADVQYNSSALSAAIKEATK